MTAQGSAVRVRPTFLSMRSPLVRAAIVVGVSLLLGKRMGMFGGLTAPAVLSIIPVTFLLFWFCKSPRWPIAAFLVATLFGLYRSGGLGIGPINVRAPDIPYLFIVGWAILLRMREGRPRSRPVGQQYVALLLGVLALSLFPVLVDRPSVAVDGLVGLLRFVQTMSLIWLLPYLLRTSDDRLWLLQVLVLSIVAELLHALYLYSINDSYGRLAGHNGPNAEGLLAAILVVFALHSPVPRRPGARLFCLLLGILCLGLARSIGSIVAIGLVLGIYGIRAAVRRYDLMKKDALVRPVRLLLLLVVVFGVVATLRPNDLPGAEGFNFSSAAYRVVVGYAGFEIWARNPVLGVGWQQSSQPDIISDPEVVDALVERFPDVNPSFFPTTRGASVHNAYVQVLAEAGLLGALVLLVTAFALKRNVGHLLTQVSGTDWVVAITATLGLLVVVIWWNDNPFFGSQPETVLAATFLGMLASYRLPRRPVRSSAPDDAAVSTPDGSNGRVTAPAHA